MIGYLNSIETMGLVDGPGVRFVVFLQGCKLRCLFCHNPETWNEKTGYEITSEDLVRKILKYKNYYGEDGGVTFSGGEPLLQPDFLIETLKLCKTCNIHTCLDTSGVGIGKYEQILAYVDLVMLDIKAYHEEDYQKMTGKAMDEFNHFLTVCQKMEKKLWIRQVIVPGINDTETYILGLKEYLSKIKGIEKIELLPYQTLGIEKYQKLNIPYRLKDVVAMNEKRCKELEQLLF